MNKPAQKLLALFAVALLLSACGKSVANDLFSEQQTEKLRGTWTFSHPDASPSNVTLTLNSEVEEDENFAGEYNIYGATDSGDFAIAWYDPKSKEFGLLIDDENLGHYYGFEFDNQHQITGYYDQYDVNTYETIELFGFTGTRSGSMDVQASPQRVSEHGAARVLNAHKNALSK